MVGTLLRLVAACLLLVSTVRAAEVSAPPPPPFSPDTFLYGASVYPEIQTPDEIRRMLDTFQAAGFNTVRVGESAWGNLERREGVYDFGWLRRFLDELRRRKMKAILGTGSYVAPQWLFAKHPEIRVELIVGQPLNPLLRKAASIHHPLYVAAAVRFAHAYAAAFKDHPAVIGWQLDNEIDALVLSARRCAMPGQDRCGEIDRSPAAQAAFTRWLTKMYRSPAELNDRWGLRAWGLEIAAFSDVKLPTRGYEGDAPVVDLAYQRFLRDEIAGFLEQQAAAIRSTGTKQWITSDLSAGSRMVSDARTERALSIAGVNAYGFSSATSAGWSDLARELDTARSAGRSGTFLTTEIQAGRLGGGEIWDAFASPRQAQMALLLPVVYGSSGSLYWSGNRFASGHWPHWGALLDLNGDPEVDFDRVIADSAILTRWGRTLVAAPVTAQAAILTDFDQVIAHNSYRHTPGNVAETATTAFFEAFHRMGIGVDSLSPDDTSDPDRLKRYSTIVVSSPTVMDRPDVAESLTRFVAQGGTVIVTPLTAYQTADGMFRKDATTKALAELTGTTVRTERFVPIVDGGGQGTVALGQNPFTTGGDGYFEIVTPMTGSGAETIATIAIGDSGLNGRPAIVRRRIGSGSVFKLAFWPDREAFARLLQALRPMPNAVFGGIGSPSVHAGPRADGSIFVVNSGPTETHIDLLRARKDRLSGRTLPAGSLVLKPFDVLWLE